MLLNPRLRPLFGIGVNLNGTMSMTISSILFSNRFLLSKLKKLSQPISCRTFTGTQDTSSPNSLKFYPGAQVLESGRIGAVANSTLVKLLLRIEDFKSVFFVSDFINEIPTDSNVQNEDSYLSVPQIIRKYGYPVEEHDIFTEDGYILGVHRIPHGKNQSPSSNRPVVWLQHGLLGDSSNWIMNFEDKSLAYTLANLGYDVWLGNARGNIHSKRHVSLSPSDPLFWRFSWHEMGVYDIPAAFNYVLNKTNQSDLYYVGHSMGTTMFFVAMAEHPELNSAVRLASVLAPVAYLSHMTSPIVAFAPYINQIESAFERMGLNEFLPSNGLEIFGKTVWKSYFEKQLQAPGSPIESMCHNILFLIGGENIDQLNKPYIPIILGHSPAGTSTQCVVHFAQLVNSGIFRQYDHGRKQNLVIYGTEEPPPYNISKITAPTAVYWGENDWLANPADVHRIAEELPNVVRNYRVKHDKYNHLDFLWAIDNHILLNDHIIDYIKKFSDKNIT